MSRIANLMLAAWFTTALLLTPMLHTHGAEADCHGACGSPSHGPAKEPADGPTHSDCPACQFATAPAVAPAVDDDTTPSRLIVESAHRPHLCAPDAEPSILLPPSCGPPRA